MDIGLPDRIDGYATAREIRKSPGLCGALLVTTGATAATWMWAAPMRKASPRTLAKPFDPATLQAMLARIAAVFASWESDAAVEPAPAQLIFPETRRADHGYDKAPVTPTGLPAGTRFAGLGGSCVRACNSVGQAPRGNGTASQRAAVSRAAPVPRDGGRAKSRATAVGDKGRIRVRSTPGGSKNGKRMFYICEMDRPGKMPFTLFCDRPEVELDG